MKKNNTTIVIPVHEFNEKVEQYLNESIDSVLKQKRINYNPFILIVSNTKTHDNIISKYSKVKNIEVIKNDGDSSFQGQINHASKYVKTEYFLILEYDDELNENYLSRFDSYYNEKELDNVGVLLNILIEVNEKEEPQKLTNEYAWSRQFVGEDNELGFLTLDKLKEFSDFKISGAIINTKFFKDIGGLKTKIKLAFNYEFMLRMLNNSHKIFVLPKIGCKHVEGRDGSLFKNYMDTMSIKERGFWFKTAKKEYFFNTDRDIELEIE
jgi:hypothetical protein